MKNIGKSKRYMTLTEAAAHFSVSKSLITRKKAQGKLAMRGDLVDVQRSEAAFTKSLHPATASPDTGESFAEGQRRKESALANLRELEFAEKAGKLIPADEARAAWFTATRMVRDRLLGLPSQWALEVAALSEPRDVQALTDKKLRAVLASLAEDIPKLQVDLE